MTLKPVSHREDWTLTDELDTRAAGDLLFESDPFFDAATRRNVIAARATTAVAHHAEEMALTCARDWVDDERWGVG